MPLYEIVGSYYHPPAKAILSGISQGTKLILRAEPTNPYDINAIQVFLKSEDINEEDHENLNSELSGYGKELDDLLLIREWHLGYIRKEIAKVLRESNIITESGEFEGTFQINFSGKPMINFEE